MIVKQEVSSLVLNNVNERKNRTVGGHSYMVRECMMERLKDGETM